MNFENQKNFNCKIVTDQNREFYVYANWIHNQGLDYWQGWSCEAGQTRISIDGNLDVFGGACLNDKLGNIKTGWDLLTSNTQCRRERCSPCTDDLITEKTIFGGNI